jgi:hypothetical protein
MLDRSVSLVAELQPHLAFLSTANTTSLRNAEHTVFRDVKIVQYQQYIINHGSEACATMWEVVFSWSPYGTLNIVVRRVWFIIMSAVTSRSTSCYKWCNDNTFQ